MSVTEMTDSLQFRSQAMAFASSSSGNMPFNVKEEVQLQKDLLKTKKKLRLIKPTTCSLGVELSHTLVHPVQR